MEELYEQLPTIQCRGKCQHSCGPIDMSNVERDRIRSRGVEIPRLSGTCPALTFLGGCRVYDIRPMICRLWGLVEPMACPHGCMPEGGWLDNATGLELLARAMEIGGRPGVPALPSHMVRELLADADLAAMVDGVMRGQPPPRPAAYFGGEW